MRHDSFSIREIAINGMDRWSSHSLFFNQTWCFQQQERGAANYDIADVRETIG
jgi:hypothetical protein